VQLSLIIYRSRRFVVIREQLRAERPSLGGKLLEVPGYTFRVFVTNLVLPPEEILIWRDYNRRSDVENRIAELKHEKLSGNNGECRWWWESSSRSASDGYADDSGQRGVPQLGKTVFDFLRGLRIFLRLLANDFGLTHQCETRPFL
jgi:hypothetical protein